MPVKVNEWYFSKSQITRRVPTLGPLCEYNASHNASSWNWYVVIHAKMVVCPRQTRLVTREYTGLHTNPTLQCCMICTVQHDRQLTHHFPPECEQCAPLFGRGADDEGWADLAGESSVSHDLHWDTNSSLWKWMFDRTAHMKSQVIHTDTNWVKS